MTGLHPPVSASPTCVVLRTGFATLVEDRLALARARQEGVEAVARVVSASAAMDAECISFMYQEKETNENTKAPFGG